MRATRQINKSTLTTLMILGLFIFAFTAPLFLQSVQAEESNLAQAAQPSSGTSIRLTVAPPPPPPPPPPPAPAPPSPGSGITINNPLSTDKVPTLIGRVIRVLLGVVGSLALVMFIAGGLMWMTAGGNSDKVKKGRDILIWATLGLLVVFASFTILNFVIGAFG